MSPISAEWIRLADTPCWQYAGTALTLGQENPRTIYAIFGSTRKLYAYRIADNIWDDSPADFPGDRNFGPGAALCSDASDYIYVLVGGTQQFWRYRISDNSWLRYPDIPYPVNGGGSLAFGIYQNCGWVYAIVGGDTNLFFVYGLVALPNQPAPKDIPRWRKLANFPAKEREGACIAWANVAIVPSLPNPISPAVVGLAGNGSQNTYYYDVANSTWHTVNDLGKTTGPGGAIAIWNQPGGLVVANCFPGNYDTYTRMRYLGSSEPWKSWGNRTVYYQYPGAALAHGRDGWVYACFGNTCNAFMKQWYLDNDQTENGTQSQSTEHGSVVKVTVNSPVADQAHIRFQLKEPAEVKLIIVDPAGRIIKQKTGNFPSGSHSVFWDCCDQSGKRISGGVYIALIRAGSATGSSCLIVK